MKAIQNLLQLLRFLPSAYRPFHLHSLFLPQRALLTLKRSSSTSPPKSNAEVLARGVDCDIVLLSVESKEYWKGAKPLRLGHLQRLQVTSYAHGSADFWGIQIDAAINPGNSGGPAFNEQGECIGVAFQVRRVESTSDANNVTQ